MNAVQRREALSRCLTETPCPVSATARVRLMASPERCPSPWPRSSARTSSSSISKPPFCLDS